MLLEPAPDTTRELTWYGRDDQIRSGHYASIVGLECKLFGQVVTGQKLLILAILFNTDQLLAIMSPYSGTDPFLAKQQAQDSSHAAIADNGNILEHIGRLEHSWPLMSMTRSL